MDIDKGNCRTDMEEKKNMSPGRRKRPGRSRKRSAAGEKNNGLTAAVLILFVFVLVIAGVIIGMLANRKDVSETAAGQEQTTQPPETAAQAETGLAGETAKDAEIDFEVLKAENADVFAWLYVPGTSIDYPVLQSTEADNYYEHYNAYKEESDEGAVYTELANMKNMCDFNTVLHGKGGKDGIFSDLYQFADPEFFQSHEEVYLYIDGNLLTYTIFAAFERDNTSLIRTYDFTYISGCQKFLDDLYGTREMGKNMREGWEDVTPYHFLITLTTTSRENPDKQYVVIAALVGDAAGTIDRVVVE